MIVAAHQTMLAPQGAPLPYDAEVEYLESTGTQYVDTGVFLGASHRLVARWQNVSYGSVERIFGQTGTNLRFAFGMAGGRSTYYVGLGDLNYWTSVAIDGTVHDIVVDAPQKSVTIDSTTESVAWTTFATNASYSATLFARMNANSGEVGAKCSGRLYSCSIYNSSTLVRDFQPVRVGSGSSAVGYLFDRVSGTLFGNAGTGAFVLGPDKT